MLLHLKVMYGLLFYREHFFMVFIVSQKQLNGSFTMNQIYLFIYPSTLKSHSFIDLDQSFHQKHMN